MLDHTVVYICCWLAIRSVTRRVVDMVTFTLTKWYLFFDMCNGIVMNEDLSAT